MALPPAVALQAYHKRVQSTHARIDVLSFIKAVVKELQDARLLPGIGCIYPSEGLSRWLSCWQACLATLQAALAAQLWRSCQAT